MLDLNDRRWSELTGGYKTPFDPRPLFKRIEAHHDDDKAWAELWEELHHQGDVGEASYASISQLVRLHRNSAVADWNTYALVAVIELARTEKLNPKIPAWVEEEYFHAIQDLAEAGASELLNVKDPDVSRAILSVLAIAKGLRHHAEVLLNYSEEELVDIMPSR